MTYTPPATTKTPKARRRKVAPRVIACPCPTCTPAANATGVFYCTADYSREWLTYFEGQFIGAFRYGAQAEEALAVYRIDQAAAQAIEVAAAERDLETEVTAAATDPDVLTALEATPNTTDIQPPTPTKAVTGRYRYRKMIVYDRKTQDFAMYLNGELCGYAGTFLQAESTLNKLVYDLLK